MEGVEESGRNVQAATEKALQRLGLDITQVDVTVINEGRGRILGFGGGSARVKVTPRGSRPAEPEVGPDDGAEVETAGRAVRQVSGEPVGEDGDLAIDVLENLLRLMYVDAAVSSRPPETPGDGVGLTQAVLDVSGDDLGILIGRRGSTLASLQYLVNLIVGRQLKGRSTFAVDVEGYRRRREESLRGLAMRMADRVRTTGQSITLEPMPPNERRIVHLTLADEPDVVTVSIGEAEGRKVAITPRR